MTHFSFVPQWPAALCLTGGLLLVSPAFGQGPGSTGPQPGAAVAIPLDGGASLLLAGGVAYGLRKLRERRAR